MVSVIILTKNEEKDLPLCLKSLEWADDVHVLDSGSTDKTCEIAGSYGAKVWLKPFESFGKQRNYALSHIQVKHEWILFLDADEVVTQKFWEAVLSAVSGADDNTAGFYCCCKMILEGRWLKHCDDFPKWQFRLLKKGRAAFKDFGHGQKEDKIVGNIEYISEPYLHFSFSKGWSQWIDRHNKYSTLEAKDRLYKRPPFKNIFSKHSSIRNPALKSWLCLLPGWPLLRLIHIYFLNLGFLEGKPGLIYSINIAYHEFLISIKMRELRKNRSYSVDTTPLYKMVK